MKDRSNNLIYRKSFDFALRVVGLYKYLYEEKKEYVLSKQLLRSGTSIGANVREATEGQSRNDFISKLSIALKEARETEYWIELLDKSGYIEDQKFSNILKDIEEIIRLLNSIIISTKKNDANYI